ncbi:response regulator transcription factor [Aliidiomarina soli]|uniref:HTH luxR-type domain-containing protein n=1 Tax=Aliidiomarina soli TaxID=1928574 RepID=A0A432WFM1_9GAMM|nr:response regulator transcription factor [Aliidiomarina soli]RUO32606.1 hypothetical protein CWE14_10735 [Aliidiomarina soli]
MTFITITNDRTWLNQWTALLALVKTDRARHHSISLREFSRLRLEPGSIIFIDTQALGMPKYLPYNPHPNMEQCSVVLTNTTDLSDTALLHFLKTGFSGVIRLGERPECLLKALEAISAGHTWFPRRIVEQAVRDYQRTNTTPEQVVYELAAAYELSKREQQVCLELIHGQKNCYIAKKLFISTHTVKCHVTNLYRKLGIRSRHEILNLVNRRMQRSEDTALAS